MDIIDPRRRLRRSRFLRDLILPNFLAFGVIIVIRILDIGTIGDLAMAAIAGLLLWSGNVAVPMARFHDLGIPGAVHLAFLVVIFYLTSIGWQAGPGEAAGRLWTWADSMRAGLDPQLPAVAQGSAQLGGLIALIEVGILAFLPGKAGPNRYGPDPREKAQK